MLEIQQSTVQMAGHSRLEQIRASLNAPAENALESKPAGNTTPVIEPAVNVTTKTPAEEKLEQIRNQ